MKPKLSFLLILLSMLSAKGGVIYSGLLNTVIPTNFDGVTVNIGGGTLNPFFGGVGVANNSVLQPYRETSGTLGTLLNLPTGTVIDAGTSFLSTGFGGSQDHLGKTFTSGQEGYIGFKLNGANQGWIRVVFTNNTGGAMIKDWAYENTSLSIATGNVLQQGSVVTTDSSAGSFSFASPLSGNTSLTKVGAGTVNLSGSSSHSGGTTINAGTLSVDNMTGSGTGSGSVIVNGGSLSGRGTIAGNVNVSNQGAISPGNGVGNLTLQNGLILAGSYQWQLGALSTSNRGFDFDSLTVAGGADVTGASLGLNLGDYQPSSSSFWQSNRTWEGILATSSGTINDGFTISSDQSSWASLGSFTTLTSADQRQVNLVWTAIPEPSVLLISGVGCYSLLLRRRVARPSST